MLMLLMLLLLMHLLQLLLGRLRKHLQILWLNGGQHCHTLGQSMVGHNLAILWHSHRDHGRLLEALQWYLHRAHVKFGRLLDLVRVEHLNLDGLLGVARLVAGHGDGQDERLRLRHLMVQMVLVQLLVGVVIVGIVIVVVIAAIVVVVVRRLGRIVNVRIEDAGCGAVHRADELNATVANHPQHLFNNKTYIQYG